VWEVAEWGETSAVWFVDACYCGVLMTRPFTLPPPLPLAEQEGQTFTRAVALMGRLLAEDGCPWDREQSFSSLRRYVLEEACEVIDAIDEGDPAHLAEELGDLSLQVIFLAELARRQGTFGPDDVLRILCEKLVRRHPHVFGDACAADAAAVLTQWEAIKVQERGTKPLLGGIPRSLPALSRAHLFSSRAATVGFDWPDASGSRAKVAEELAELDEASEGGDLAAIHHEVGDLLFAVVNFARHLGVEPEAALRDAGDRFHGRFAHVEAQVKAEHGDWPRDAAGKPSRGLSLEELDAHWNEAKALRGGQ
jgi:MazG family protein